MYIESIKFQRWIRRWTYLLVTGWILAVPGRVSIATNFQEQTEADEDSQVASVPPAVALVRSGGYWCDGERRGFYRVVVWAGGFEEVFHHLYVQQVEIHDDRRMLYWPV